MFLYRIPNFFLSNAIKFMYKPNGQIQPQKNLPEKRVAAKIAIKNMESHKDIVNEIKIPINAAT